MVRLEGCEDIWCNCQRRNLSGSDLLCWPVRHKQSALSMSDMGNLAVPNVERRMPYIALGRLYREQIGVSFPAVLDGLRA